MNPNIYIVETGLFFRLPPKKGSESERMLKILAWNADRTHTFPAFVTGESELGHSYIITTGNL